MYKGKYTTNWNKSLIYPIFKKGNRNKVENYRGITVFGYKVISLIILKKFHTYTDEQQVTTKVDSEKTNQPLIIYLQ